MIGSVAVSGERVRTSASSYAHWVVLGLVLLGFCLPLLVGLGRTDLLNDEAIYSFAVDVMLYDGDWLNPKSSPNDDEVFLEKPPLKFWIVAAPIRLGLLPDDEFGLRFWDAVFGGIAFLYVFAIGRRLGGTVAGAAAVLVLFAHRPLLFEHGLRSNNMEAALLLSYCGGVYHFLAWQDAGRRSRSVAHLFAVTLYFVLAFMTKFVAALFLPLILAVVALAFADGRARLRRDARTWMVAGATAIALIAPWFLYEYHRFGGDVWRIMFGMHVFSRFTEYLDPSHLQPWHYYFSELLGELRWSGVVTLALGGLALVTVRTIRHRWREGVLLLAWFALPLAVISFGTSKLYHYAYPFLPPVALAAGCAAGLVAQVAWRIASPLTLLDAAHARALRGLVRSRTFQVALLAVGFAALGVAVLTYGMGHLWLRVGDSLVFRNSSPLRAALVGIVALGLCARLGSALRIAAAAAVLSVFLPVAAYADQVSHLDDERHPMHPARDCLRPICARAGAPDPRGPGVWAEGDLNHVYSYYLRPLGPYQQRSRASDVTVFMHLYAPSKLRPVLLAKSRYEEFTRLLAAGDASLLERAARKAEMDPAVLAAAARQRRIGVTRLPDDTMLLLPGPFAACGTEGPWTPAR